RTEGARGGGQEDGREIRPTGRARLLLRRLLREDAKRVSAVGDRSSPAAEFSRRHSRYVADDVSRRRCMGAQGPDGGGRTGVAARHGAGPQHTAGGQRHHRRPASVDARDGQALFRHEDEERGGADTSDDRGGVEVTSSVHIMRGKDMAKTNRTTYLRLALP